jgi:carbon storage regulator CsrA
MVLTTTKREETVLIGGNIRVTVALIRANQVHLGVEAPPELAIRGGDATQTEQASWKASRAKPSGSA